LVKWQCSCWDHAEPARQARRVPSMVRQIFPTETFFSPGDPRWSMIYNGEITEKGILDLHHSIQG
jgi:hypothetical protein